MKLSHGGLCARLKFIAFIMVLMMVQQDHKAPEGTPRSSRGRVCLGWVSSSRNPKAEVDRPALGDDIPVELSASLNGRLWQEGSRLGLG